jgi:predicted DNA-binding transcriptional regulator YafY
MANLTKVEAIFKLIEEFIKRKELTSYDSCLLDYFKCSERTLSRYFETIETLLPNIIKIEKTKKSTWRLITINELFEELVNSSRDIGYLFSLASDFDPTIFSEMEKSTLKKLLKKDESIFFFRNYILEELKEAEAKEYFEQLKNTIKNYNCIEIEHLFISSIKKEKIKPIKLMFMNNNWYVAAINSENKIVFIRISFIVSLKVLGEKFNNIILDEYLKKLPKTQNAMTLLDKQPKKALLKANPYIARYFKDGMKKYLHSQKYIKTLNDGSIIFSVEYTQELEILPFIQQWLPDLIILEPKELQETYIKKLQNSLKNY